MTKEAIISTLSTKGYRITPIRIGVVDILLDTTSPLTASEIRHRLKSYSPTASKQINKTTIYREISTLLQENVIHEINFANSDKRYELLIERTHHHHLVCEKCHIIEDVVLGKEAEKIQHRIEQQTNFKINQHAFEFYGLCKNCQ